MDSFNALKQADEVRTFPNIDMPLPVLPAGQRTNRFTERVSNNHRTANINSVFFGILFLLHFFFFAAQKFILQ
jgi:hypothetical protein